MSTRASLVARALTSAWYTAPLPLDISIDELNQITPLLLGSGAGSLGWHRIRSSHLKTEKPAVELQQAYRKHTLEAALHESHIKQSFSLLRDAGIEPILVKGWAIARQYPEKGLRPYDDVDLIVRPEEQPSAESLISTVESLQGYVDIHCGLSAVDPVDANGDWNSRTRLAMLGDLEVRILKPEENLRTLCLHLLRHGAFRPLWLCDIAVAVESRGQDFDWDRCLSSNKRVADWVASTIALAHKVLGARIEDTPIQQRAKKLPSWLPKSLLEQWERPFSRAHGVARHRAPMASYIRNPSGLFSDLRARWPNPIEATIYMRGSFNALPRWPFQVGECVDRTMRFVTRLPKSVREK
jgi:hypothetical protein